MKSSKAVSKKSVSKKCAAVLMVVGMGVSSASVVGAIGGGAWYTSTAPLQVSNGGGVAGQTYGTFKGYSESQTLGSILSNQSYHRARNTSANYKNGAYVQNDWSSNGYNCYVSSYSESGGSVSCQNGWSGTKATTKTPNNTSTTTWSNRTSSWKIDGTGSSGRTAIKVCIDISLASDPCGGPVWRGADY